MIPADTKQALEDLYSDRVGLLHGLLTVVDRQMAQYLHSNDRRKIVNALFKYYKQSAINEQQGVQADHKES